MTVTATYEDNSNQDVTANATFNGYDMSTTGEQTVTVSYTEGDITKTATYGITVNPIPTHIVTWIINGSSTEQSYEEGASITFPDNPADIEGKVFVGWATEAISGTTDTAPTFVTSATMGSSDVTYYAVFATKTEGRLTEVIDELDRSTTGVTGTSYTTWSGKTSNSSAVYAGQSAGGNNSIQLRSTSPSGIVTTKTGGKAKKIQITWNSSTSNGRKLDIYGSNKAYTGSDNLYDGSVWGTSIGNIVYGTSTEYIFTSDYDYIGVRSNSGAMYIDKIAITWVTGTPDTFSDYCTTVVAATVERPVITLANNPFYFSTTATITCATEGSTIKYSFDGENWSDYTSALTITETKTIYAKAVKGNDESAVAQITATKNLAETTVTVSGELTLDLNGETNVSAGTLTAAVTYNESSVDGATVTWSSSDSNIATIDPSTGAVTLVATGEVTFTATYAGSSDYAEATGSKTITVIDSKAPGTEQNPYTVAEAIAATPSSGNSEAVYIRGIVSQFYNTSIVGDGSNYRYYISDDGTTTSQLLVYKGKGLNNVAFSSADDLQLGDVVVITGQLTTYSNTPEVASGNYIVSIERIVKPAAPTFSPEAGTYETAQSVTISSETDGVTIYYTTDGTDPTSESTEYTAAIDVNESMTIKAIAVKDNVTSLLATATYIIDPNMKGTRNNPYTVTEARDAIDANTGVTNVYVTGIVSQSGSLSSGSITYWISNDGSKTDQLQVYKGKNLNNTDFTSADDIHEGDVVIVYGTMSKYNNTTYEVNSGNYLVSHLCKPVTPTFSREAGTYTSVQTVEISCATDGAVIYYTTDGTDPTSESTEYTAAIDVNASMTIKAIAVKDDLTSDVATAEYVIDFTPSIVFGDADKSYDTSYDAGNTNVYYTASNISGDLTLVLCDADGNATTYDWFRASITSDVYVHVEWDANTDTENARTAYFKLVAGNVKSPIYTVTQAKFVADYATLPFTFDGGKSAIDETNGLTQSGLGNDYNSSPKLKFDGTGDYLILKINERPGTLTFDIKGNSFSGSTFKVQTSEDGTTYTELKTYTELGDTQNESFDNLGENVRYIKWIYTNKSSGNVALGNIILTKPDNSPRLSVDPAEAEPFTYEEGGDLCGEQIFTVTGTNLTTEEITVSVTGEFDLRGPNGGYGNSSLTISSGDTFGVNINDNLQQGSYSGTLTIASEGATSITISLTGTVTAPVPPAITVAQTTVSVGAAGGEGTIDVTYTKIDTDLVDVQFYTADGTEVEATSYDWIAAEISQDKKLSYVVVENTGEARTAYLKVYSVDDNGGDDLIYSDLITISQAAASSGDQFALFNGDLVEGDYIIYYDGYAMNTTVSNNRLQYEKVTPENDIITTDDASIVWHIAPSGDYWTIYSADADAYAAGTGYKNQAQMLSDGTDDKALWTVSGNETYEFINKKNNANNANKNLRNNGTNGFACYSTQTGGALSLYKRASATITLAASGYASYCCDKALDFSTNSKIVYRAWYVSDVTGSTVTFSEITGKVKAGEGIILYGTPGAKCSLPYANNGEELTGNMLRGTLEPTEVTTEMVIDGQSYTLFGLSNGQFVKMKNGTVKANKAFLPILTSQVPTGNNARLDIVFSEETDGIKSIENGKLTIDNSVYDLQGRRVETMKKGSLYIVNGKKFVSK